MEEAQGETFLWDELKENFIQDFLFILEDAKLVEATKHIKTFIQPTSNESTQNKSQPNIACYNIRSEKIPQSTRLQLENECTYGRSFQWKIDHLKTITPIKTILKIDSTNKNDTDRMIATDFPINFSQFKEGSQQINESKALEWMDAKVKTK